MNGRGRFVYGVWMTCYVTPGGAVVVWFNGGGLARLWYGPPLADVTEGTRYDKYVWEKLVPLRHLGPDELCFANENTFLVF